MRSPALLSVTCSDTSGCSGLQLDGRVASQAGIDLVSVVTTVTWQTHSRRCWNHLPPRVVAAQIDSAAAIGAIRACSVGVLPTAEVVRVVGMRLCRRSIPHLVLHSSILDANGERLLCARGAGRLAALLPRVDAVVANPANAAALLAGIIPGFLDSQHRAQELAQTLVSRGAAVALIIEDLQETVDPARARGPAGGPPAVDDKGRLLYDVVSGEPGVAGRQSGMPAEDLRCSLIAGLLACSLARDASLDEAWEDIRPHAERLATVTAAAGGRG